MIGKNDNNQGHGPLQIVHDFKFTALNVKDDYSILDSMGYTEKAAYIRSRIDRLCRMGYGGVVMNVDYKDYLRSPEGFRLFFECAEYARSQGMRVWIYDEQYYPSGSAGGLTLVDRPELEAVALACVTKDIKVYDPLSAIRIPSPCGYSELKYAVAAPIADGEPRHSERRIISDKKDLGGGLCFYAPAGEWRVWCFFIRPLYELTQFCMGTRASRRYISVFNKNAVEEFYRVTFEKGYKEYYNGQLSDIVDAVFTDEPYSPFYLKTRKLENKTLMPSFSVYDEPSESIEILPYIPWEQTVPQRYSEKYGRRIEESLPDLFCDTPTASDARIKFYTLLSEMSMEAFPEQMSGLLGKDGVALSGHYYGEESFDFQPVFFGDILEHLGVMGIPGCDCLWSDIDRLRYSVSCKLASSAAHRSCRDEVMIEASNMVDKDQNITLKKAKAAISAMFIHGITLITSYYGENMLPEEEMKAFAGHISSLSRIFLGGKYRINTLLYYPFENLCADRSPMGITEGNWNGEDHLGIGLASETLMKRQVCFDFINKKGLLSCELCDGYLMTPYGERVKYVVFPDIPFVDNEVAVFICEARRRGVEIIFNGKKREITNIPFEPLALGDTYPTSELSLDEYDPYITVMHRAFDEYDLFMVMNTDGISHKLNIGISIGEGDKLFRVDHLTGEKLGLEYVLCNGKACVSAEIPELEHMIIGRWHTLPKQDTNDKTF